MTRMLRWVAAVYLLVLCALAAAALGPLGLGWRANLIASGSMAPSMPPGTILVTAPAKAEGASRGDIVVVRDATSTEGVVAHRVVERRADNTLVTRGDALRQSDPRPRRSADVVGIGRYAVPAVGVPVLWVRKGQPAPVIAWLLITSAATALVTWPRKSVRHRSDLSSGRL